jgi:hypothetical protein
MASFGSSAAPGGAAAAAVGTREPALAHSLKYHVDGSSLNLSQHSGQQGLPAALAGIGLAASTSSGDFGGSGVSIDSSDVHAHAHAHAHALGPPAPPSPSKRDRSEPLSPSKRDREPRPPEDFRRRLVPRVDIFAQPVPDVAAAGHGKPVVTMVRHRHVTHH